MKIGNVEIPRFAALAPMAGVADRAMRELCFECGAGYTVGELTSAKGISLHDNKSLEFIRRDENVSLWIPQLFGYEPEVMALAAKEAEKAGADIIDINMGCPAPKVAGNGGGSALMKDIPLAKEIVSEVVKAVKIPVTVKMRTGWDSEHISAVELAKAVEEAGAKAVTVHGRTREQMYAPPVDLETIKKVKREVKIPVIANGDIFDGESAEKTLEITGCDYVMVGRAAMGNPFVFSEINAYFEGKSFTYTTEEKMEMLLRQVRLMLKYKEERKALCEARKHTAWYMKGLPNSAKLRRMCSEINCYEDVEAIVKKALEETKNV